MAPETAEILGLQALGWLVGEPDRLERFLRLSGVDGTELRQAAGTTEQSCAIFEFLLTNEDLLLNFCETSSIAPKDIHAALRVLEGTRC